jgi:hypothetical protein
VEDGVAVADAGCAANLGAKPAATAAGGDATMFHNHATLFVLYG